MHYHPRSTNKPTILFIHGFPSSSFDWRRQFGYFASRGYGVIAPDLLGFGGSDKPADAKAYTLKTQANELIQLLDCTGVGKVFSVGHDLYVTLGIAKLGKLLITYDEQWFPSSLARSNLLPKQVRQIRFS